MHLLRSYFTIHEVGNSVWSQDPKRHFLPPPTDTCDPLNNRELNSLSIAGSHVFLDGVESAFRLSSSVNAPLCIFPALRALKIHVPFGYIGFRN